MACTLIWGLVGFFVSLSVFAVLFSVSFFPFKLGRIYEEHIFIISCIDLKENWKQTPKWFKLYAKQRPLSVRDRKLVQSILKNR